MSRFKFKKLFDLLTNLGSSKRKNQKGDEKSEIHSEDLRGMQGKKPVVSDYAGCFFIYEQAFRDRRALEDSLFRLATYYMRGKAPAESGASKNYVDELRFRMSDKRRISLETFIFRFP
jgi:hypothetical protein